MSSPRTASQGTVWQPESRQPLDASFAALADWLCRGLWLCCAVSAVFLVVELWETASPEGPEGQVQGAAVPGFAGLSLPVSLAGVLALVVTGVLWLVWQRRAASAAGSALRHSPARHVRSWFVPVASLWLVPQNLADLWRIYRAPRRRSELPPGPPWLVYAWWLSCVGSASMWVWAAAADLTARTAAELQVAGLLSSLAALTTALAAGVAASLVSQLSWYALLIHAEAS